MASERDIVAAATTCFLGSDPWVAFEPLRSVGVRYVEVPALPARQSIEWRQTTFSPEMLGTTGTRRLRERLTEMDLVPITVGAYASVLEPDDIQPLLRRIANLGRFLGDYAEAHGVRLAFEIHEGLARSGAVARRLLDAIDHSAVGVNYDTGNAIFYNREVDTVADLETIIDRVIHVHLKDTSGGFGEWTFGALGTGHVDLPRIVGILKSRGFRGPYSLEVEGFAGEDLTRESRVQRLRQSLEYLAGLGIQP